MSIAPGKTYRLTAAAGFPGVLVVAVREQTSLGCLGWFFDFQTPRPLSGLFIEHRDLAACLEGA